jgi:hypothetical protein
LAFARFQFGLGTFFFRGNGHGNERFLVLGEDSRGGKGAVLDFHGGQVLFFSSSLAYFKKKLLLLLVGGGDESGLGGRCGTERWGWVEFFQGFDLLLAECVESLRSERNWAGGSGGQELVLTSFDVWLA